MNNKYKIIALVLLIAALVVYFVWFYAKSPASTAEKAVTDIQTTVESINQNVSGSVNPAENIPDVNPYKDTNPFSDIKTNPFQ